MNKDKLHILGQPLTFTDGFNKTITIDSLVKIDKKIYNQSTGEEVKDYYFLTIRDETKLKNTLSRKGIFLVTRTGTTQDIYLRADKIKHLFTQPNTILDDWNTDQCNSLLGALKEPLTEYLSEKKYSKAMCNSSKNIIHYNVDITSRNNYIYSIRNSISSAEIVIQQKQNRFMLLTSHYLELYSKEAKHKDIKIYADLTKDFDVGHTILVKIRHTITGTSKEFICNNSLPFLLVLDNDKETYIITQDEPYYFSLVNIINKNKINKIGIDCCDNLDNLYHTAIKHTDMYNILNGSIHNNKLYLKSG